MKKFLFIFILGVYSLFFIHSLFPFLPWMQRDTIYFTAGFVGWVGETKNHPGTPFYGLHLPTLLKKYNLKVKTAKQLRKCPRARKIVNLEIMEDKAKYFKFYPQRKMVLILFEPPSVLPQNYDKKYHKYFSKIYTFDDDLVDNKKYFKFHYPELRAMREDPKPFEEKKLCTLIAGDKSSSHPNELYSKRREVIRFFENKAPQDFDLYGQMWSPSEFSSYLGSIPNKECLLGYKFCFAYENMTNINGYITEKIFDCFHFGCVPIYLGADNICDYIPKNCFIDRRDFTSLDELYKYLKTMSQKEYETYIRNIQVYLQSEQAKPFSREHFYETLKAALDISD